jgi:hypothetical protein
MALWLGLTRPNLFALSWVRPDLGFKVNFFTVRKKDNSLLAWVVRDTSGNFVRTAAAKVHPLNNDLVFLNSMHHFLTNWHQRNLPVILEVDSNMIYCWWKGKL